MTDPPLAVRERRRDSTPGDSSSAQMNARHEDGTPAVNRATISATDPGVAAEQLIEAMGPTGAFSFVNAVMFEITEAIL